MTYAIYGKKKPTHPKKQTNKQTKNNMYELNQHCDLGCE